MPITADVWRRRFSSGRTPVDARGQNRLDGTRYLDGREILRETIVSAFASQHVGLAQRADTLLDEERVAVGSFDQEPSEWLKSGIVPDQGSEQFLRVLGRKWVDAELRVVGLARPPLMVLRAVVDEKHEAVGG